MTSRPHQLVVRVTDEANARLRTIAKHYRLPLAEVARGMMERGYRPWLDDKKANPHG